MRKNRAWVGLAADGRWVTSVHFPCATPTAAQFPAWAYIRARALPAWAYGRPAPVYLNIRMLKLSRKELMESQVEMERTLLSLFVD